MKYGKLLLCLISVLLMTACNEESDAGNFPEKISEDVKSTFLLFKEEYATDVGSVGDLYIKRDGEEVTKIASGVRDGQFTYYNDEDKVLFITENNTLFQSGKNNESIELAKDVFLFNGLHEKGNITYQNADMDLYLIKENGSEEKIASSVNSYELVGNDLFYTDESGDFLLYNVESREEKILAEEVATFSLLNREDDMAYTGLDGSLYYKTTADGENVKVSSDVGFADYLTKVGDFLYYVSYDGEEGQDFYAANVSENTKAEEIASGIVNIQIDKNQFYYTTEDSILYTKTEKSDTATRLASEVLSFVLADDGIYFQSNDENLYKWIEEENKKEKIGTEVLDFHVTPDGKVLYQNKDKELFVNNKKITSDLNNYSYFHGTAAFATEDNRLYVIENMEEEKVVEENIDDFSAAYFHNRLVYSNLMDFEEIAGTWKATRNSDYLFMEINDDGVLRNLETGEEISLEIANAGYQYLQVYNGTSYRNFRKEGANNLYMEADGIDFTLTKSSQKEAETYYADLQLKEDKESAETMISSYIQNFAYAVNSGEFYYIQDYIDPLSNLYNQQSDFVVDMYGQNVMEELVDYTITEINSTGEGVFELKTEEVFILYHLESGKETKNKYDNIYTVKKDGEEFLITDLEVSQEVLEESKKSYSLDEMRELAQTYMDDWNGYENQLIEENWSSDGETRYYVFMDGPTDHLVEVHVSPFTGEVSWSSGETTGEYPF